MRRPFVLLTLVPNPHQTVLHDYFVCAAVQYETRTIVEFVNNALVGFFGYLKRTIAKNAFRQKFHVRCPSSRGGFCVTNTESQQSSKLLRPFNLVALHGRSTP